MAREGQEENSNTKDLNQKNIKDTQFKSICKAYLRGKCPYNESCQQQHDTKQYPCAYLFGVGICDNLSSNCKFSHEGFRNEHDINIFIKDNEEFLIDIYRTRKETKQGYYFIRYLKDKNERDTDFLFKNGISLPKEMPTYIPPQLLIQNIQQLQNESHDNHESNNKDAIHNSAQGSKAPHPNFGFVPNPQPTPGQQLLPTNKQLKTYQQQLQQQQQQMQQQMQQQNKQNQQHQQFLNQQQSGAQNNQPNILNLLNKQFPSGGMQQMPGQLGLNPMSNMQNMNQNVNQQENSLISTLNMGNSMNPNMNSGPPNFAQMNQQRVQNIPYNPNNKLLVQGNAQNFPQQKVFQSGIQQSANIQGN